jgi:hypothetical protein
MGGCLFCAGAKDQSVCLFKSVKCSTHLRLAEDSWPEASPASSLSIKLLFKKDLAANSPVSNTYLSLLSSCQSNTFLSDNG